MKGIANPQLKAGGLQIRRNKVTMVKKKIKKFLLKTEYFVFLRKN
jgi:hypothetical protein